MVFFGLFRLGFFEDFFGFFLVVLLLLFLKRSRQDSG